MTEEPTRPSKSERKREAHAAQALGEALIGLPEAELAALELPERLLDAIRDARRITSRGGGARQRQLIGKLMRTIDLTPVRAALAAHGERASQEAERFKRLTEWRERLIGEGPAALDELEHWRPGLARKEWERRIEAARLERVRLPSGNAARELLRALRSLFEADP